MRRLRKTLSVSGNLCAGRDATGLALGTRDATAVDDADIGRIPTIDLIR